MASRTSEKKRSLRQRNLTCTRSQARTLKYTVPDLDIEALRREIGARG